ncbi:uncharacterized protein LOC111065265 [Drosophila obscura]|uniref:uncharacterized protein LOC111065265 n=1 Tax=Drosophila obscura TaxID=7282 RepID=UPI000BA07DD2|nr:uncharacterized protein LOC111065265 [Drosophila obscura]
MCFRLASIMANRLEERERERDEEFPPPARRVQLRCGSDAPDAPSGSTTTTGTQTLSKLWCPTAQCVDFRYLKQELHTAEEQLFFLNDLKKQFRCVHFDVEVLQEHLEALERAGIDTLNSVQECILIHKSKHNTAAIAAQGDTQDNGRGRVGGGPGSYIEWPLHSLPKLMPNLRVLSIHCNIQVHFIERFTQLELLFLNAGISQGAITGVFERCRQLRKLIMLEECDTPLDLSGVLKCPNLCVISVPVSIFANQRELLATLPNQEFIELTHCGRNSRLTVDCLHTIFGLNARHIAGIQMDCSFLENGAQGLTGMAMGRLKRVLNIRLINCDFQDAAIDSLDLPDVQCFIVLNRCRNVTNNHVLGMLEQCPRLRQLYVLGGHRLTGTLLHGICRLRSEHNPGYPLNLIVTNCQTLLQNYNSLYAEYWQSKQNILQVECYNGAQSLTTDVQLYLRDTRPDHAQLPPHASIVD